MSQHRPPDQVRGRSSKMLSGPTSEAKPPTRIIGGEAAPRLYGPHRLLPANAQPGCGFSMMIEHGGGDTDVRRGRQIIPIIT